jgi:AcrR family transcriptional regulator
MAKTSKEQIISTAEKLIMEKNNSEVSLSQISDTLGITHGALYKHFENKQDLWTAVSSEWFKKEILDNVHIKNTGSAKEQLHGWIWSFVNAKKVAYNTNSKMFTLNTKYIDNNPESLSKVLQSAYVQMNKILGLPEDDFHHVEMILATFSIFTLPNFKDTWNDPQYQERFEAIWNLIKEGI